MIDRLEFLENDKLSTYDQLLEAQSEIRRLEKQLREHKKSKEAHEQAMENEHHAKVCALDAPRRCLFSKELETEDRIVVLHFSSAKPQV